MALFVFYVITFLLAYLISYLDKVKEDVPLLPLSQAVSGRVKTKLYEEIV